LEDATAKSRQLAARVWDRFETLSLTGELPAQQVAHFLEEE